MKFILKIVLLSSLFSSGAYALSCQSSCSMYSGMAVYILSSTAFKNTTIGKNITFASMPVVTYSCDYICNNTNKGANILLCVDRDKYLFDGSAMQKDPLGCIFQERDMVVIDSECSRNYTFDMLFEIIEADPNGAFFICELQW
ncbi:hypothetical protein CRU92_04010 [Arcobacter sp. FW59]|nr:hypothetical protein CRU92_04010 [Arcobacter sp. FW59]